MNKRILDWLERNPAWILRKDFTNSITDYYLAKLVLRNSESGFLTHDGKFYSSLRDVPSFVGIQQVIEVGDLSSKEEMEHMQLELGKCSNIELVKYKKRAQEAVIIKANNFLRECDLRLEQLKINQKEHSCQQINNKLY